MLASMLKAINTFQGNRAIKLQTIGTLTVAVGLLVGVVSQVINGNDTNVANDWIAELSTYAAIGLVVAGLFASIYGRSRDGGHV